MTTDRGSGAFRAEMKAHHEELAALAVGVAMQYPWTATEARRLVEEYEMVQRDIEAVLGRESGRRDAR